MSGVLNCWFQTTCRFWTLFELICASGEKRELETSPSPLIQLAPAGVTPFGSHDAGVDAFFEADAIATTTTPRISAATTARPGNFRMRPLPPLFQLGATAGEPSLPTAPI